MLLVCKEPQTTGSKSVTFLCLVQNSKSGCNMQKDEYSKKREVDCIQRLKLNLHKFPKNLKKKFTHIGNRRTEDKKKKLYLAIQTKLLI